MIKKALRFGLFFVLSLPKTVYFNFASLPFGQAVKLPILIGWNTKIIETHKGIIHFDGCRVTPCMVRMGFGGSRTVPTRHRGSICLDGGSLTFEGRACFAAGSAVDVSGDLRFGKMFSSNKNAMISCSKKVTFGNEVMLGWNVCVFDASGHTVYHKGEPKYSQGEISVGDHVWICSEAHLLKGAKVGSGSIVAWRSLLTKPLEEKNVLIAGSPATVKQHDISWGPYVQ